MNPSEVKFIEVCSRDGIQNLEKFIPTEDKIKLIKDIIDAGADEVEFSAFVHPKWVPQMADVAEVFAGVKDYAKEKGVKLIALVPNKKGAERAKEIGVECVNLVISASEEHNRKNVNKTIDESLEDLKALASELDGVEVRLATACAFGSPFGDEVPVETVLKICQTAVDMGATRIGLADSAGVSSPDHTKEVLQAVKEKFDVKDIIMHLHDTRGMGLANAYVGIKEGVVNFEGSLGALGGCPFIPGAKGNIGSEDFVNMVKSMGLTTKYDIDKMMPIVFGLEDLIGKPMTSSMVQCSRSCK